MASPFCQHLALRFRLCAQGLLIAALVLLGPGSARALDGKLGFRQSQQDGGFGAQDYSLQVITRDVYAQQLLGLWPGLSLRLEAQVRDEATQSRIGATHSAWNQLNRRAGLALRYGDPRLHLELRASGRRREQEPDPGPRLSQDIGQLGLWSQLRASRWLRLQGSWLETRAWREEDALADVETRESLRSASAESPLSVGTLRYGYARQATENLARGNLSVHASHLVGYDGGFGFQDQRGRVSLSARARRFEQALTQRELTGRFLLEPASAGLRIDASPEVDDPLEEPLSLVPALIDLDRRSATEVDLGDDAPVGLQLGGDYRNLQVDLGAPTAVSAVLLYVDRRPTAPELMQWSLYVAEDPEGRLWTRHETASASARYRDWDEDLQGWEFTFAGELVLRHFKLVNAKLGPVEPELRVTEIEAYAAETLPAGERRETSDSRRLQAGLDYRLSQDWRARADFALRLRNYATGRADQDDRSEGLGLFWARGEWSAAGRLEWRRLDSGGRRDSDVDTRSLSLRRRLAGRHALSLHFDQLADRGRGTDRLSRTISLGSEWQFAPGLRLDQRLSHGWLRDEGQSLRSRSLTSFTALHSVPFSWLFVELSRVDRWVEREAGYGYSRFNDTTLTLGWTPVPLISLRSHVVYQDRGRGEWLVNHSLAWTPLPGGDLSLRLIASQFSDTRVDSRQNGAGATLAWTPRPRLLLETGVDAQRLRRPEGVSSPVNGFVKGSLAF